MKKTLAILGIVCVGLCANTFVWADHHEEKAKYSIKQIMKEAHGKKLLNKVVAGDASKEEKQKLLDLYLSLIESKPPVGDADSWHKKSDAVIFAAARVVVGRDGAIDQLKAATKCAGCHGTHKPKK